MTNCHDVLGAGGMRPAATQVAHPMAVLPKRPLGASSWPEPDRPLTSLPHPDLLRAILNGLRNLGPDGAQR